MLVSLVDEFNQFRQVFRPWWRLLQGGYDDNDNGILEASEVLFENDVCNGEHGFQALVRTPIPPGEECPGGGIQFEIGLDVDRSNFLEEAEVETNLTTCFEVPEAGFNSLVSLSPASAEECPAGGSAHRERLG